MSNKTVKTVVEKLAALGISAELHTDGNVKMTMKQLDKLQAVIPSAGFQGLLPKEGRVIVSVNEADVDAAIAANKKAPRTAANVEITARMVYEIKVTDAANEVTYAEWSSDDKTGYIVINGTEYTIGTGVASDFYEVGEESDPNRQVYFVELTANGQTGNVTSYGVTNLIRRICAIDETIG